ncbi:hypothetical protein PGB90_003481 [Kerria lacca]
MNTNFSLYVGTSTGILKGVRIEKYENGIKAIPKNLVTNREDISNKNEIKCLNWNNDLYEEILIGMKKKVQIYNTKNEQFTENIDLPLGECCGIFKENEALFVGSTSGVVYSIQMPIKEKKQFEMFKLNKPIDCMKKSSIHPNIIGTGGKNNDLKLWDINTHQMTFIAKNIKPDELQLPIPIWVSDLIFLRSSEKIATCMRHGYVRLYDPLLPQRRPVFNAFQQDKVFTCICDTPNDNQFLVGSGSGDMFLVDIRGRIPFAGKYKGFCGSIKNIICPPTQNLIFSVSLDRHFRIHNFKTRKLLFKDYMFSRLTTLLCKEPSSTNNISSNLLL